MVWFGLILGIIACSSSAIFIRSTDMDPSLLAAVRLYMASLLLLPIFIRDRKTYCEPSYGELLKIALPAGFYLALHFISWNFGIRMTFVAHGTLIVNMVPIVLPFILWLTHRERINRGEILATVVSIIGVVWLAIHDYHYSPDHVWGDVLCFGSMILLAVYLSYGRKYRKVGSTIIYVVPVYLVAASICFIFSIPNWGTMPALSFNDFYMAFCLALIPTVLGHTFINYSMRVLRGQVVGIMNAGQFISAGIFAYFIFSEVPSFTFYIVSSFIVFSCLLVIRSSQSEV